jgi:hypothetical protein
MKTSRIPGFYAQTMQQRLNSLEKASGSSQADLLAFQNQAGLTIDQAEHMVENVIGIYSLPLGLGLNFIVNGRDVLVPMRDRRCVIHGTPGTRRRWVFRINHAARNDRPDAIAGYQ